jgi:hypothetical protein
MLDIVVLYINTQQTEIDMKTVVMNPKQWRREQELKRLGKSAKRAQAENDRGDYGAGYNRQWIRFCNKLQKLEDERNA